MEPGSSNLSPACGRLHPASVLKGSRFDLTPGRKRPPGMCYRLGHVPLVPNCPTSLPVLSNVLVTTHMIIFACPIPAHQYFTPCVTKLYLHILGSIGTVNCCCCIFPTSNECPSAPTLGMAGSLLGAVAWGRGGSSLSKSKHVVGRCPCV